LGVREVSASAFRGWQAAAPNDRAPLRDIA
jgi:hypothetical protein